MDIPRGAILVLVGLLLTGCIGYHASKGRYAPGYSEGQVAKVAFRITYNGPGRTRESLLRANVERRATEVCPSGFSLTDYRYDEVAVMHGNPPVYNVATAIAHCR